MAQGNLRGVLSGSVRYIQGPAGEGGYYLPKVEDGILSWIPSSPSLPAVEAANVRGPAGKDGTDGKDGKDGADGAKGDKGDPGYTPQRGIDYWTEEDKTTMESEVVEELTPPALTGFAVSEGASSTTVVNTYADGSRETLIINFNDHGKPVSITINGVEVPGSWLEV